MEFKGTKGKWNLEYDNRDGSYNVYGKEIFICTTMNSLNEDKYNALLISKAPEMLEMLGDIRQALLMENSPESLVLADVIEQLIKEATEL